MPNNTVFSNTEILELCDSIKDIHQVLKTVGKFYNEIDASENQNGNAFLKDCKKWGIKTVTTELLEKQYHAIDRISAIYREEQENMKG